MAAQDGPTNHSCGHAQSLRTGQKPQWEMNDAPFHTFPTEHTTVPPHRSDGVEMLIRERQYMCLFTKLYAKIETQFQETLEGSTDILPRQNGVILLLSLSKLV